MPPAYVTDFEGLRILKSKSERNHAEARLIGLSFPIDLIPQVK